MCITKKGWISGIVAGILLNVFNFIFGALVPGRSAWYATAFPGMSNALGMIVLIIAFFIPGLVMGLAYDIVHSAMPWKKWKKGLALGIGTWLLAGTMWPIMMISYAPTALWIAEFITGFANYVIVGMVVYLVDRR
ncbi:MAG: hypothetical protein V1839_03085 [archaeon]